MGSAPAISAETERLVPSTHLSDMTTGSKQDPRLAEALRTFQEAAPGLVRVFRRAAGTVLVDSGNQGHGAGGLGGEVVEGRLSQAGFLDNT